MAVLRSAVRCCARGSGYSIGVYLEKRILFGVLEWSLLLFPLGGGLRRGEWSGGDSSVSDRTLC